MVNSRTQATRRVVKHQELHCSNLSKYCLCSTCNPATYLQRIHMHVRGLVRLRQCILTPSKLYLAPKDTYLSWQIFLGGFHSIIEGLFNASPGAANSSVVSSPSQRGQGWGNPVLARQITLQCTHNILSITHSHAVIICVQLQTSFTFFAARLWA